MLRSSEPPAPSNDTSPAAANDAARAGAFASSMPPGYRRAFGEDAAARAAHAAIVQRRGEAAAHLELWGRHPGHVAALCLVATDRPGLLAQVFAALVAFGIGIDRALAFSRALPGGGAEAVDFLWVRRVGGGQAEPLEEAQVAALGKAIDALVSERAALQPTPPRARAAGSGASRVRFEPGERGAPTVLTVEASDRPGLLLALTQTFFRAGLQIVGMRAETWKGCVEDRFELREADGTSLGPERRLVLQTAVLEALDASLGEPL